ncbi:serine hydrolase [Mucilaginibacter sp. L3T2-6]|uniref:serine hydrolase domain-containing protein n=1 Tax=Mucilaginibacter sp. L3T2-6 TaxID=3062491 RepID=UPI002674E1C1|nr:serine hydrolase domain-containing protein [Mucilaginibacter sp. L3T2-6]MDO3642802.1 serine hydrolase domain-containing protein [Mucilaginibacter sp. L3T2-6]MDV6215451.1 serine hydrolase domain-containing protein [Mucilaginibacter sp. L3T2-6]
MKRIVTTLLLLTVFGAGWAQTFDKAKLDQFFDKLIEKKKAMGSLYMAKDGKAIYQRSIGYSYISETEKKPIDAATKFRIGSVTKMFTAAMVFQLAEEGKLKLTDTLNKFFPQVPGAGKITIENILAHRAGIHDIVQDRNFRPSRTQPITKDEMLGIIAKTTPDFEPDEKYAYSNTGYIILGCIIEKVTGKSYEEVLKKKITTKIGLKDTYSNNNIDVNKNESLSYKSGRDWELQPETHTSILFGSGSLTSTPSDLAKFIQALFDRKLISKESLSRMMQLKSGMDTFTYNGKTLYGHTGGVDGFGSWLVYLPEEKLAVCYATNAKVYPVGDIMDGIFNIYWDKPFNIPAFESIAIAREVLDTYTGVYTAPPAPVRITITRDTDRLFLQMNSQSPIPLEPVAENKFKIEPAGPALEFDVTKKQLTLIRNDREKVFTKEN